MDFINKHGLTAIQDSHSNFEFKFKEETKPEIMFSLCMIVFVPGETGTMWTKVIADN